MKLEQQVVSLELAKKLKELGVKQGETLFEWIECYKGPDEGLTPFYCLSHAGMNKHVEERWSAFTVAELGEMLPEEVTTDEGKTYRLRFKKTHSTREWLVKYVTPKGKRKGYSTLGYPIEGVQSKTEADARAKMLIYLLENDLLNK